MIYQTQTHSNNSLSFPTVEYLHGSSSSSASSPTPNCSPLPFSSLLLAHDHHHHPHHFPLSWSQLLLRGLGGSDNHHQQEERFGPSLFQSTRVMSNNGVVDVKQEVNSESNNNLYGYGDGDEEQETTGISNRAAVAATGCWSHSTLPASSPKSCVTSLSSTGNSILDFSTTKTSLPTESHSNSECNSTATGAAPNKKPRVQSSSNPPLQVRKEKLGDRITTLHQLVSPFGKTDTASVLMEAIGYIRFLQGQIEALSSPYLGGNNSSAKHPHAVHGERSCLFHDHFEQGKAGENTVAPARGLSRPRRHAAQVVAPKTGFRQNVIALVKFFVAPATPHCPVAEVAPVAHPRRPSRPRPPALLPGF